MADSTRLFSPILAVLDGAFRRLEAKVPAPQKVPWQDGFTYRHTERTIQQAIVQKLARRVEVGLGHYICCYWRGFFRSKVLSNVLLTSSTKMSCFCHLL